MNLPFMIIEQIKSATGESKTKAYLPYGMVFTLIFVDAEIDLDGEDFKSLTHIDYYTIYTLHRMKYQKVGDEWVKEIEGEPAPILAFGYFSSSPSDSDEPSSLQLLLHLHHLH